MLDEQNLGKPVWNTNFLCHFVWLHSWFGNYIFPLEDPWSFPHINGWHFLIPWLSWFFCQLSASFLQITAAHFSFVAPGQWPKHAGGQPPRCCRRPEECWELHKNESAAWEMCACGAAAAREVWHHGDSRPPGQPRVGCYHEQLQIKWPAILHRSHAGLQPNDQQDRSYRLQWKWTGRL